MIKCILLTGGTGFLGSGILKELLKFDYKIIVLMRKQSNLYRIENLEGHFELFCLNESLNNIEELFSEYQIDAIVHTATEYGRSSSASSILQTNLILPIKLVEEGIKNDLKLFINTDTFSSKVLFENSSYLRQYNKSKKYFLDFLHELNGDLKVVNMRLEHIFGELDSESKFVTSILRQLLNNQPEVLLTDGQQKRDFIYIDDVVTTYLLVLGNFESFESFTEFEVGNGESIKVRQFVETLFEITESKSELKFGVLPTRKDEIHNSVANITSLKKLGWKPTYDLKTAFIKMIKIEKKL